MEICKPVEQRIDETITETVEHVTERIDEVCEDLPWPLDWFCHAVTTVIKWVETIVHTVTHVIVTIVCTPIEMAANRIGDLVNALLEVPILGAIARWLRGAVMYTISQGLGAIDTAAGLIGIRPMKNLSLHVIVLKADDGTPMIQEPELATCVAITERIYRDRADIRVHTTVHTVDDPSPANARFVDADVGFFGEDATGAGTYFQEMIRQHVGSDLELATGLFAPVVAFVVGEVEGTKTGCSGGPFCDYVVVEPGVLKDPLDNTLAHEVGHALGLLHDNVLGGEKNGDVTNLMFWSGKQPDGTRRGENLSPFQRGLVRASAHVSYL